MKKQWCITINGATHNISYSDDNKKIKNQLLVDGKIIEIPKNLKNDYLGIDMPINIEGVECRFVAAFKVCDIVVDGQFVETKKSYRPIKIPFWAWLFVVLSCLIPVVSIGGAIPVAIASLSALWCLRFSANPFMKLNKKVLYNILTVICAWVLFGLLLFGLS